MLISREVLPPTLRVKLIEAVSRRKLAQFLNMVLITLEVQKKMIFKWEWLPLRLKDLEVPTDHLLMVSLNLNNQEAPGSLLLLMELQFKMFNLLIRLQQVHPFQVILAWVEVQFKELQHLQLSTSLELQLLLKELLTKQIKVPLIRPQDHQVHPEFTRVVLIKQEQLTNPVQAQVIPDLQEF